MKWYKGLQRKHQRQETKGQQMKWNKRHKGNV